jgi:tetratricopeptide (TPR) repeat protein
VPHDGEESWGRSLWDVMTMDRDFTAPGMFESVTRAIQSNFSDANAECREMYARESRKISPHSPLSLYLTMFAANQPTVDNLRDWEQQTGGSPTSWIEIGNRYYELKQYDGAIRCYKQSLEISRSYLATISLAATYRKIGETELWRQTLESYFEVDDLGLQHSRVHQRIAQGEIDAGNWEAAEPHALAAAQTWSASGLKMAATVAEGLGHWEESERWIREMSTSYPSSSGPEWYFWCRRTGRGDLDTARRYAEGYFAQTGLDHILGIRHWEANYVLLEGRRDEALEIFREMAAAHDETFRLVYVVNLAAEANDAELLEATLEQIDEGVAEYKSSHPNIYEVIVDYVSLMRKKKISDDEYARINRVIETLDPNDRCWYHYVIGMMAARRGDQKIAEEHWGQAVTEGPFDELASTLSGNELAKIHGTSR